MAFWKQLFNKTERTQTVRQKNWKQGMWVQTQDNKTGILFSLGDVCEVHLVDRSTGETKEQIRVPLEGLRQARWGEIPECRRGITKEQAEALGYGA